MGDIEFKWLLTKRYKGDKAIKVTLLLVYMTSI